MKRKMMLLFLTALLMLTCCAWAKADSVLRLPDGLTIVGVEAFYRTTSLDRVVVPEGVTTIESRAFAYSGICSIRLPDSVKEIADDAFEGCENLSLFAPEGCFAQQWASRRNLWKGTGVTPASDFTYWIYDGECHIQKYTGTDVDVVIPAYIEGAPVVEYGFQTFSDIKQTLRSVELPETLTNMWQFYNYPKLETVIFHPDCPIREMGSPFVGCISLVNVQLPGSVETIQCGFQNCTALRHVELPDSLLELGSYCFDECTSLEEIVLPDGIAEIKEHTFSGCKSLKHVHLPAGLKLLGRSAFTSCEALEELVLPEGLETIGPFAISHCVSLKSLTVPDSVTTIDSGFIAYDTGLETLVLGSGIKELTYNQISVYPSADAPSHLKTVIISEGVESIGQCAFSMSPSHIDRYGYSDECYHELTYISLPRSLKEIGDHAFYYADALTTINIPADSALTSIGDYAFYRCEALEVLDISRDASLQNIGEFAFYGCLAMRTMALSPDAPMDAVNRYAFYDCNQLKHFTIPNAVTDIGDYAFCLCGALEEADLPAGMLSLGVDAYSGCSSLRRITMLEGLETIGSSAFSKCTSLESLTIPDSVISLGENFISGACIGRLVIGSGIKALNSKHIRSYMEGPRLKEVVIREGIDEIGDGTFCGVATLERVELPDSVTVIGAEAFRDCAMLRQADIPAHLVSLGASAFYGCSSLTSIHIPSSLTGIPEKLCMECTALSEVILPDRLTDIGAYAFYNADRLTGISIPTGVTAIGTYAFYDADSLTEISIPASVTAIGDSAFQKCDSLVSVDLSEGLQSLGGKVFADCPALEAIHVPDSVTILGNDFILNDTSLRALTLGGGVAKPVTAQYRFSQYSAVVPSLESLVVREGVTELPPSAFKGCAQLVTVDLPGSLQTLSYSAFADCTALRRVMLREGLKSISASAFSGCTALTRISVPESVTYLGKDFILGDLALSVVEIGGVETLTGDMLHICRDTTSVAALQTLVIRKGVKTLGENLLPTALNAASLAVGPTRVVLADTVVTVNQGAFENCTALRTIEGTSNLKYIGKNAFSKCPITSIDLSSAGTISAGAFRSCKNLASVSLPSAKTLESEAFRSCTGLGNISLGSQLTSIGSNALADCTELKRVSIPNSVTSLGNGIILNDLALTHLEIGGGVETLKLYNLYLSGDVNAESALQTVIIHSGVKEIDSFLFSMHSTGYTNCNYPNLTSVTLPDTVTSLGNFAFANAKNLTDVRLSAGLSNIDSSVFMGCNSLNTIYGTADSYAQTWAEKNGYTFIDIAANIDDAEFSLGNGIIYLGVGQEYTPDFQSSMPVSGVSYTSSNPLVLDVSGGTAGYPVWTARGCGVATVTAEVNVSVEDPSLNRTLTAEVRVCLSIEQDPLEIEVGDIINLDLINTGGEEFANGHWSTADKGVASFDHQTDGTNVEYPTLIGITPGNVYITYAAPNGSTYTRMSVTVTDPHHTQAVSKNDFYRELKTLKSGEDPLENEVIYDTLYTELYNTYSGDDAYGSHSFAKKVLELVDRAPDTYRDIYIYSFFEYDKKIVVDSGDSLYSSKTGVLEAKRQDLYYWDDAEDQWLGFITKWFHESGHAIDHKANDYGKYTTVEHGDDLSHCVHAECVTYLVSLMDRFCEEYNRDIDSTEMMAIIDAICDYRNRDTVVTLVQGPVQSFDITVNRPQGLNSAYVDDYMSFVEFACLKLSEKMLESETIGGSTFFYYQKITDAVMFSDVMSGVTNGAVHGNGDHGGHVEKADYWFKDGVWTNNQIMEAWAEYFASNMSKSLTEQAWVTNRRINYSSTEYFDTVVAPEILSYLKSYVESK